MNRKEEIEYVAKVISDGRMIGASWMQIAGRLVEIDIPGMGYVKPEEQS